jgi:Flp pilus assembly secretin CpaC
VKARLSSSSKSLPTLEITDDATKVSSRQGSRDIVAPPPSYEITSRIKVVAEQSSTIAVRDAILQTSIEDPSICRLIQSGDTGLSVVGLKAGTTRIAVVTAGRFGEPKVNVHEVSVGHGHQARIGLTELAAGIDETINRLYPTSDIRVAAGEGKLVVEGKASSESEAKRVLGLVRRTSLLPVVDRLDVR